MSSLYCNGEGTQGLILIDVHKHINIVL